MKAMLQLQSSTLALRHKSQALRLHQPTTEHLLPKALANHIDVAQATEANGFDTKSVDPHFAHLLNAYLPPSVPLATGEVLGLLAPRPSHLSKSPHAIQAIEQMVPP
jgi:hypothetical protein